MPTSMPWYKRFFEYLVDNVFDLITIAAVVFVFIRHEFIAPYGINDISDLVTWLIAILGLMAISALWERHRRLDRIDLDLQKMSRQIAIALNREVRAEDYFGQIQPDLADITRGCKQFSCMGMVLNRFTRDNMPLLRRIVNEGGNIRVIISNFKDEDVLHDLANRSTTNLRQDPDTWRVRLEQTMQHLRSIDVTPGSRGTIHVGLLPYPAVPRLIMIDPDEQDGKILARFDLAQAKGPGFVLDAAQDVEWFKIFKLQFDLHWKACEEKGEIISVWPLSDGPTQNSLVKSKN